MNPPSTSLRDNLITLMASLILLVGLALALTRSSEPRPGLDGLDALLAMDRFDEVERRLNGYLAEHPESAQARVLMAQVALARPENNPRLALEQLGKIATSDDSIRAIVRLNEGKAYSSLGLLELAEAAWIDALRKDPLVPEAGWALLGLYYVEERREEARRLGLALHTIEPDPKDRVQLLLELVRQDARPIVASEIIRTLEPAVREHPDEIKASEALARAYLRDNRPDEGLSILQRLVERSPDDPAAWKSWLDGLEQAARPEELALTFERLPAKLVDDPRFALFQGIISQNRGDWSQAAHQYLRARASDPTSTPVLYRLVRAFRIAGQTEEADRLDIELQARNASFSEILPLYNRANQIKDLGLSPNIDLYRSLADVRERMGHEAEALAWHRLILKQTPGNLASRTALDRLTDARMPNLREILEEMPPFRSP
ncbi:tetratricopeptide repeat protein [Tundrisphaera lichenicola]|uniref:tetratricopeptide repeat protein n=1 Tax=Tundrisphaera lichenicola TaxID=2029860 RepID=UPI003EB76396